MKLDHLIILQNKVDIIMAENTAPEQYKDIQKFVEGTIAEGAPIIPISAQLLYNIDVLCDYLTRIPVPVRDFTSPPEMTIVRSFDINKPGTEIDNLEGGVVGGSLLKGMLKVGDQIEIRPGIVKKDPQSGVAKHQPIISRIVTLRTEGNDLLYAVPGGLIAIGL